MELSVQRAIAKGGSGYGADEANLKAPPYQVDSQTRTLAELQTTEQRSMEVLEAIGTFHHEKVEELLLGPNTQHVTPEELADVLVAQRTTDQYSLMTPLMAATVSGNLRAFYTVLKAVDRYYEGELWKTQLKLQDQSGMTVLMLAARGGNIPMLDHVLGRIKLSQVPDRLLDRDYNGNTVLVHAARANVERSASFNSVLRAIEISHARSMVEAHLLDQFGDNSTILTVAAKGEDRMLLHAVLGACERNITPRKARELVQHCDGDGMTFLMHAASGSKLDNENKVFSKLGDEEHGRYGRHPQTFHGDLEANSSGTGSSRDERMEHGLVGVFMKALWFVRATLWKEQVREQLKAKDLYGRTVLMHAMMSGKKQVFDRVLAVVREEIGDDETGRLLNISDGGAEDIITEHLGSVPRKVIELEQSLARRSPFGLSGPKIDEFIPGKLVVVFLLILSDLGDNTGGALILLLAMTAVAPILAWATQVKLPSSRRSKMTSLLSAPSMFFWGVATSSIGQDSFGWSNVRSAGTLLGVVVLLPVLETFFASRIAEQWYDQLTWQRLRFLWKVRSEWRKNQYRQHTGRYDATQEMNESPERAEHSSKLTAVLGAGGNQASSEWRKNLYRECPPPYSAAQDFNESPERAEHSSTLTVAPGTQASETLAKEKSEGGERLAPQGGGTTTETCMDPSGEEKLYSPDPQVPDSSDSAPGREVAASSLQTSVALAPVHVAQNLPGAFVVDREAGRRDDAASFSKSVVVDQGGRTLSVSEWGEFSVHGKTEDVSQSGVTVEFDLLRDKFWFVEVKVAHEESALMNGVKFVNMVFTEELVVSGERATYFIDPVVEGPSGLTFSGASIRYFSGRYDDLVAKFGLDEGGESDMESAKADIGSMAVDAYLPVVKPDDSDDWKAYGKFTAIWKCDELWLESQLTHFSWFGRARKQKALTTSPSTPEELKEYMENGKIEAAGDVYSTRTISLENATQQTVWTCTLPDATPAENVANSSDIGVGITAAGYGFDANRARSLATERGATGGASSVPLQLVTNRLSSGVRDMSVLGGHGDASVVWYTVDTFTASDLRSKKFERTQPHTGAQTKRKHPLICGFDLALLKEEHDYVVDTTGDSFVRLGNTEQDGKCYPWLKLVRIRYNGRIAPGHYSRMHQEKLEEGGVKDFVLRPGIDDVDKTVKEYIFRRWAPRS